jgi:sulfide:quinone oxidoreductase
MHISRVLFKGRQFILVKLTNSDFSDHYKLLIAGGSTAGNAIASYFSRKIDPTHIAVIEPSEKIYYQPGFTLVASNLMKPDAVVRNRSEFHPKGVKWIKNAVGQFNPKSNSVVLNDGSEIGYDFLVCATGLELRFDMIEGLPDAFQTSGVCSIYDYKLAQKTRDEIQNFKGGNAIFTFPNTPIKCAGAPQKILYLSEEVFRKV